MSGKQKNHFSDLVANLSKSLSLYLRHTQLLRSNYYSKKFGANIYFKLENIQQTGSFKARGAMAKALSLSDKERKKGFIAASAGNHGLGVCFAARALKTKARIFMPKGTPDFKVRKIVEWGGEPVLAGEHVMESNDLAQKEAARTGMIYFHPFDDEIVMQGQATIAHEILSDLPQTDMILCSIGGGGLIAGIARYAKEKNSHTGIYGIETGGADSMTLALRKKQPAPLNEVNTVAESIAVRQVGALTFPFARKLVDGVFVVDDNEALKAQIDILQQIKMLVEPAASCCLAALEKGLIPNIKGRNIVIVLCGGNYPVEKLARTIQSDENTVFKITKDSLRRQLEQFGLEADLQASLFDKFYREIKKREADGYAYFEAEASLDVFARQFFGLVPEFFSLYSYRVFEERVMHDNKLHDLSEASIKLAINNEILMNVADSLSGPVSALDKAMRKILVPLYPVLDSVRLTDYRVRILTPHDGAEAVTRVMIESQDDKGHIWRTVGVSADIIGASYAALQDSYFYKLLQNNYSKAFN